MQISWLIVDSQVIFEWLLLFVLLSVYLWVLSASVDRRSLGAYIDERPKKPIRSYTGNWVMLSWRCSPACHTVPSLWQPSKYGGISGLTHCSWYVHSCPRKIFLTMHVRQKYVGCSACLDLDRSKFVWTQRSIFLWCDSKLLSNFIVYICIKGRHWSWNGLCRILKSSNPILTIFTVYCVYMRRRPHMS